MIKPSRLTLPVLALALVAAGCGTQKLDTDKAETEIEKGLQQQLPQLQGVQVSCPDDVEIKANSKFTCTARRGDQRAPIEVVQQDDEGNIRWTLRQRQRQ